MMNKKFFVVVLSAILALTMMPTGVMADEVSADEVLEETMSAVPEGAAEIVEPEVTQQPETPVVEMPVAEIPTETPEAEVPATEAPAVETPTEAPVVEIPAAEAPAETPVVEMPVEAPVAEVPETVSEATVLETVSEDVAAATSENTAISENATEEANSEAPVASGLPASYKEALEIADSVNFATASISSVKHYSQPAFYTNSGYDAVSVYITNSKGEYAYRTFFVTDGSEWLMYDYEEYAAKEFFSQTELKNGKYVPVQKAATRKDNTKTSGIDESKIPTITEEEYNKMVYDWRPLANVPLTRDANGKLVYAGEGSEDPVTPAPTPDGSQNQTVITIGDNTYDIRVIKSVSYTGKRHVASGNKATKSQSPDLAINIYRNGVAVSKKNYSLKYANNLNVDGYGKEGVKPYFTVTLKGKGYAKDAKVLAKNKFTFSILPVDIAKANFSAKKVRVSGEKVTLGTPTVKLDGVTRKVSPRGTKNPRTGAYIASYAAGKVTVTGVNNFAGSMTIDLLTAKSMDYNF
ncbi:hypothetical protein IJH16_00905 [Candidatus Saccharibacteria bacterium]|nr:hypothetical protein [Candidatus Saccharibacteria bacterium]